MRPPDRASVNLTYEPSATTVPAISSRPPLEEPATSFVVQVVLYVPSSLIRVTMSPWTCPESPVMTCPNDPRHVPLRSDSLTDAAESSPARADAAFVLDVAQPRHRRVRADPARLRPRTPGFVRAPELGQQDGAVKVRRNEIGILLHELVECVEGLLPL